MVHSGPSKCSEFDAVNSTLIETKGASHVQEDAGKKKKKKSVRFLGPKLVLCA